MTAALKTNFPSLYQSISELPYVTNGWNNVPGTAQLTTFSGAKVTTTPEVGAYFASDVVPFVVQQRANYQVVDTTWPELPVFPPLLLIVGILVILFGGFMLVDNAKNGIKESED